MRRIWFPLLMALLLAACSSAPQRSARSSGESTANAYRTKPPGFPDFVDHSIGREEIPIQAMSLVGIPYRWGGNTPDSGFDCSGLVRYVLLRSASVNLPRTTAEMSSRGEAIEPDQIATGDLVFFNTTGRPHSHVGIYVGKLRFVDAPSTGGTVRLDYLNNPYWAKHFDGIRRVAPAKMTPAPFDAPTLQAVRPPESRPDDTPAAGATAAAYAAGTATTTPAAGTAGAAVPSATGAAPYAIAPTTTAAGTTSTVDNADAAPARATPTVSPAAAPADAFEPPPTTLNRAQQQAREAGAVTPPVSSTATQGGFSPASTSNASNASNASGAAGSPTGAAVRAASTAPSGRAPYAAPSNAHPDAIDAAADAFEPPPPTAAGAERQARAIQQQSATSAAEPDDTQIMRASTASRGQPIRTAPGDDPIARFANGSF